MPAPVVISLPWSDPADAAARLGPGGLCLAGGGGHPLARWSFVMDEPAEIRRWSEGDRGGPFDGLQAELDAMAALPGMARVGGIPFQGGWAGLLSYELGRAFERLPWPGGDRDGWPDLALGLHDTVCAFDAQTRRAWVIAQPVRAGAKARAEELAHRMLAPVPPLARTGAGGWLRADTAAGELEQRVARCVGLIRAGDIFQANISLGFSGRLAPGDAPVNMFRRLLAAHPAPMAAFLDLGERAVVSHAPERFLTRSPEGVLETRPIKGTRPRSADPVEDAASAADLLGSEKDRAENLMIVDLMRNDLSRVCVPGSVRVPDLMALERFSTVHHLTSRVEGRMRPGLGFFDALAAAFPPGSITGAPKVRAMEIIADLERAPRGPWCGSMLWAGWDGAADSSVLIRTAACVRDAHGWEVRTRAGAGIVADSDPAQELAEMLLKARALREAVGTMTQACAEAG